jgi:hypothetical protein
VKTLYRWEAIGEPQVVDNGFDRDATLLEERVLLIKADSLDQAIERAEREAIEYAKQSYKNYHGQTVQTRYLGCCDAYDIGEDSIGDGIEVFSSMQKRPASIEDSVLIDNQLGNEEIITGGQTRRDKFWNAELL